MKTAQTIDQVIAQLDDVVAWSRQRKSRLGYFAALYRRMTQEVKNGIVQGRFQDGARMEKLDVIFANRYLAAFNQRRLRRKPTQSWQTAFARASDRQLLILQHLLLGMNAHINLDLGIAAAQTSPGNDYAALQKDFDQINLVLTDLYDRVKAGIETVSPAFYLIDQFAPARDEKILFNFSVEKARGMAWASGQALASVDAKQQPLLIARLDEAVAALAVGIALPNLALGPVMAMIAQTETQNVGKVMDAISNA